MRILGIETSCDETAAAVVERDPPAAHGSGGALVIRSSVVASQTAAHQAFGGVVPEIASRRHLEWLPRVVDEALAKAKTDWRGLDALAVTVGPGLIGALVIGVAWAKAAAWQRGLPVIPVNHLEGHIYSPWAESPVEFPFLCLLVSGGHSHLVAVRAPGEYELVGRTRDDAAGEAFDKGARLLDLEYPGGPAIDRAAQDGDPRAVAFPRAWLPESWDFSFSGVKAALARYLRETPPATRPPLADLAASYQEAIVEVLAQKSVAAAQAQRLERLVVAGGVAANRRLRALLAERAAAAGIAVRLAPLPLCTDNAAMIALAAAVVADTGRRAGADLDAAAVLPLDTSGTEGGGNAGRR